MNPLNLIKIVWCKISPTVDYQIGNYTIELDTSEGIQRAIYLNTYEPIETKWIRNHLKKGDVFIDAGSNIGYYSLIASQIVEDDGSVYAFEPVEQAYKTLSKSITRNRIKNIDVIHSALGNTVEEVEMFRSDDGIFSPTFLKGSEAKISIGKYFITTLDAWIRLRGISRIDFMKIDVEGYEPMVLEGAKDTLAKGMVKFLMIEMSGYLLERAGTTKDALHGMIESLGFKLVEKKEYPPDLGNYLYRRE